MLGVSYCFVFGSPKNTGWDESQLSLFRKVLCSYHEWLDGWSGLNRFLQSRHLKLAEKDDGGEKSGSVSGFCTFLLLLQTIWGFCCMSKVIMGLAVKNECSIHQNAWALWEVALSVAPTSLQSLICIQEAPPWRKSEPRCFSAAPETSISLTQIGPLIQSGRHFWTQSFYR